MSDREDLHRLRRLRELETRASRSNQVPQQSQPQQEPERSFGGVMDFAKGLKHGFDRAAYGMAELFPDAPISDESRQGWNNNLLVKSLGLTMPSQADKANALSEGKQVSDSTYTGAVGDFIGNAAPNIGVGISTAGAGLLPAMTTQAATSFLTTPGDVGDRSTAAAWAAGGEGVGRALPLALSRVAQPIRPTEAAQRLINQGVYPTPGQAAGGGLKKFEDALTSHWAPGVGSGVVRGQRNAMDDAASLAMSQGGLKVPAGREGFKRLDDFFSRRFDDATAPLSFDINDPQYLSAVKDIMLRNRLTDDGIKEIDGFFNELRRNINIMAPDPASRGLAAAGQMEPRQLVSGKDFHAMLQQLRSTGKNLRAEQGDFNKRIGNAYRDIYNLTDDMLSKQNLVRPEDIKAFRDVRRDYAAVAPALKAGELAKVNQNKGFFTPEQYHSSMVRNANNMGNKAQVRTGTLPQQQLADDMVEVMGNRYPDSGTSLRMMVNGGLPAGAFMLDPLAGIGTALGVAGMYGLSKGVYSNAGRRYMVGALEPGQVPVANALRKMSPTFGTIGASTAPQIQQE
jgi:hypothetical protein